MKIYISGKISGEDLATCTMKFGAMEMHVNALGHQAVNPMALDHKKEATWQEYMRTDIKALMDCDAIFCLPDWRLSKGAIIERNLAKDLDIPIYYTLTAIKLLSPAEALAINP